MSMKWLNNHHLLPDGITPLKSRRWEREKNISSDRNMGRPRTRLYSTCVLIWCFFFSDTMQWVVISYLDTRSIQLWGGERGETRHNINIMHSVPRPLTTYKRLNSAYKTPKEGGRNTLADQTGETGSWCGWGNMFSRRRHCLLFI